MFRLTASNKKCFGGLNCDVVEMTLLLGLATTADVVVVVISLSPKIN